MDGYIMLAIQDKDDLALPVSFLEKFWGLFLELPGIQLIKSKQPASSIQSSPSLKDQTQKNPPGVDVGGTPKS